MNNFRNVVAAFACWCFLLCGTPVFSQDKPADSGNSAASPPPKVLVIGREFLKPGRGGEAHQKGEAGFVRAMAAAKWPTHYLAVTSLTGRPRALFFTGYGSFADWEKDAMATQKNAVLTAALDRAAMADGDLLAETDGGAFIYREDYSLNANVDIAHMRYFEISQYHVKPGHEKDWDAGMKMVLKAYEKIPDAHFACYQVMYGVRDGTYLFFTPLKSAAEIDTEIAHNKDFETSMGADAMKQLAELSAAAIDWSENNLFAFDARMSYVSDDWIKADPQFWKPKAAGAPAASEKKPPKPEAQP